MGRGATKSRVAVSTRKLARTMAEEVEKSSFWLWIWRNNKSWGKRAGLEEVLRGRRETCLLLSRHQPPQWAGAPLPVRHRKQSENSMVLMACFKACNVLALTNEYFLVDLVLWTVETKAVIIKEPWEENIQAAYEQKIKAKYQDQ
ncbi:hypothetical protein Bbelb_023940 [Branchiostoma belcheri]|nr:hypothetical protein Bbelb_023940 [Branchiostoma belcheri]